MFTSCWLKRSWQAHPTRQPPDRETTRKELRFRGMRGIIRGPEVRGGTAKTAAVPALMNHSLKSETKGKKSRLNGWEDIRNRRGVGTVRDETVLSENQGRRRKRRAEGPLGGNGGPAKEENCGKGEAPQEANGAEMACGAARDGGGQIAGRLLSNCGGGETSPSSRGGMAAPDIGRSIPTTGEKKGRKQGRP